MLGFIGSIGFGEMVLIGIIGLLIFGSSLPTVGRKLGRGLMEFKKGLRGIKDEIDDAMEQADAEAERSALDQDRRAGQEAEPQAALPRAGGQADASASAAAAGGEPAAAASAAPADAPSSGEASSASPAGDSARPESAPAGGSDPSPAVAAADAKNAADKPAG
jgi:sec-independent protein translocase protein TatA